MKFTANVDHESARPHEADHFCTVPIEGDGAFDAARTVANLAARRRYGDDGEAAYVEQVDRMRFRAAIGVFHAVEGQGVVKGVTVNIRLFPVE